MNFISCQKHKARYRALIGIVLLNICCLSCSQQPVSNYVEQPVRSALGNARSFSEQTLADAIPIITWGDLEHSKPFTAVVFRKVIKDWKGLESKSEFGVIKWSHMTNGVTVVLELVMTNGVHVSFADSHADAHIVKAVGRLKEGRDYRFPSALSP